MLWTRQTDDGMPRGASRSSVPGTKWAPVLSLRAVFGQFWPYTHRFRARFAFAIGLGLVLPVLQAAAIWLFKILIDEVLVPKDLAAFGPIALAYMGLTVAIGVVTFSSSYLSRWLAQHFVLDMRTDVFRHLHSLSLDALGQHPLGDLLSRLTSDVNAVQRLMVSGVTRSLGNILRVLLFTGILFWLQWRLALAAIAVVPMFYLIVRAFSHRLKTASQEVQFRAGNMNSIAEESLANAPLVQAYQQQDHEVDRYEQEGKAKLRARLAAARLSSCFGPLVDVLELLGVLAVVALGTWQMAEGALTLGGLLAFIGYLSQLYSPIRSLSRLGNVIFAASAGAERIGEIFSRSTSVPDRPGAVRLDNARGEVSFQQVKFRYPRAQQSTLNGLSFEVGPGEVLALAGPSGAGKTTVAKLLDRLYDPQAGSIRLDGYELRDLKLDSVRSNISLLLQETMVFHGSIYDNIAYGRPGATAEQIYEAARIADLTGFIEALPDGYGTIVAERGRSLSGGQRQRIAIARALVRDAPVLILDEPATGLDDLAQQRILPPLQRLMAGRSTIIISHDERSLALADRVLYLQLGDNTGANHFNDSPTAVEVRSS